MRLLLLLCASFIVASCAFQPANRGALFSKLAECMDCPAGNRVVEGGVTVCDRPWTIPGGKWQTHDGSDCAGISSWDISQVTNLGAIFKDMHAFNQDISNWDVSSVTDMHQLFSYASVFDQDLTSWDVSRVKNMDRTFIYAHAFQSDISGWDVSQVTNMNQMFFRADAFHVDIGGWNVSQVTNFNGMFRGTTNVKLSFNQDISAWDMSSAENLNAMFQYNDQFNQDISTWDVSGVTNFNSIFGRNVAFDYDLSAWDVSSATTMINTFLGGTYSHAICGAAWLNLVPRPTNADLFTFGTGGGSVASEPCECPYNLCLDTKGQGQCSGGTCICASGYTGDRCNVVQAGCGAAEFQNVHGACQAYRLCPRGFKISHAGNSTNDRKCGPCAGAFTPGENAATECQAFKTCAAEQFMRAEGNTTHDRACQNLTQCGAMLEYHKPTAVSDRACISVESVAEIVNTTGMNPERKLAAVRMFSVADGEDSVRAEIAKGNIPASVPDAKIKEILSYAVDKYEFTVAEKPAVLHKAVSPQAAEELAGALNETTAPIYNMTEKAQYRKYEAGQATVVVRGGKSYSYTFGQPSPGRRLVTDDDCRDIPLECVAAEGGVCLFNFTQAPGCHKPAGFGHACHAGYYCPDYTEMLPCPTNTFSVSGAVTCSECPPNTGSVGAAAECVNCQTNITQTLRDNYWECDGGKFQRKCKILTNVYQTSGCCSEECAVDPAGCC